MWDGEIETAGESRWQSDVVIEAGGPALLAVSAGELDVTAAESRGLLSVEGDRRLFRASMRAFAFLLNQSARLQAAQLQAVGQSQAKVPAVIAE